MPSHHHRIDIVTGDITQLAVEVVVNAANGSLLGGGGVDGAIHRTAGRRLLEHNRGLGGCPTGEARLTPSFDLASRGILHIVHTVGPVWRGDAGAGTSAPGSREEDVLLARCYDASLALAASVHAASVAFPAISTGVFGFPKDRASRIARERILAWLRGHEWPARVVICCFSDEDAGIYRMLS